MIRATPAHQRVAGAGPAGERTRRSRGMGAAPPSYGVAAADGGLGAHRPRGLKLGRTDDPAERAADRFADEVTARSRGAAGAPPASGRHAADRLAGGSLPGNAAAVLQSPGRTIGPETRAALEPAFGFDLSGIRIHDDASAHAAATQVMAHAFTAGRHIAFARGRYAPGTSAGLRLLAHEVAHTRQPGAADVARRSPDAAAVEKALERAKRGSSLLEPDTLCGGQPCFDDSANDALLEKSHADDVAAEARATAERKRRRDIRATGTKQSQWRLKWETDPDLAHLENIGQVSGVRDDGIMTPSGVRVPQDPDHLLNPRPFYETYNAAFLAWQGFIHYAEIVEAHEEGAAADMALLTNRGYPIRDDALDLYAYTHWTKVAHDAREKVQNSLMVADGALALTSAIRTASAAGQFVGLFKAILARGGWLKEATIEGVAFGGIEARVVNGELFVGYSGILNVGRVPDAGKVAQALVEDAAQYTAKAMGLSGARVGVHNLENPVWRDFLLSRGYTWAQLPNGNWATTYLQKAFPAK